MSNKELQHKVLAIRNKMFKDIDKILKDVEVKLLELYNANETELQ